MAAIGRIRKHSTLLLIVVAVALLAFILGDFTRKGGRTSIAEKFIVAGKSRLSHEQFMNAFNARKEQIKAQRPEQPLSPEEEFQVNEQLYNELLDSMLFAMQTNAFGHHGYQRRVAGFGSRSAPASVRSTLFQSRRSKLRYATCTTVHRQYRPDGQCKRQRLYDARKRDCERGVQQ